MRRMIVAAIAALFAVLVGIAPTMAQDNFASPGGAIVDGKVWMCLNASAQAVPCSQAGATLTKVVSAASTNATVIKASAGTLYDINAVNTNAATAYLKFYNKATAPTCNSDTVLQTIALVQNVPVSFPSLVGKAFSAGIGLCITGALADNDNTNATTGITLSVSYK